MRGDINIGSVFNGGKDPGLEYHAISGTAQAMRNMLESQVILQLLVNKGIISREEVEDMRKIVNYHNKDVVKAIESCKARLESLEKTISFNDTMTKVANGTATESDKKAAMDYLDEIKKHKSGGDL